MRLPRCPDQRSLALFVVEALRDAGYEALWAGGCVRDQLLGREPKDYDVATNAPPSEVVSLFGKRQTLAIGAAFGVIAVRGGRGIDPVEVATFRTDGQYSDGRRPDGVVFSNAREDAIRRDFTINAIFFDPLEEEVIDYVEGELDLKARVIRAVGEPSQRFKEDKLRLLRAVRFAATYEFTIEPATFNAIIEQASEIKVVSAERIGMELSRMLLSPQRKSAVTLLRQARLLPEILPEVEGYTPAEFADAQRVLDRLESPTLPVALAALLGGVSDLRQVAKVCSRFRLSNHDKKRTCWLCEKIAFALVANELAWSDLQPLLVHAGGEELIGLSAAKLGASADAVRHARSQLQLPPEELDPPPLVTGDQLIAAGMRAGPHFAPLLKAIRRQQLMGELQSTEEALVWAKRAAESE